VLDFFVDDPAEDKFIGEVVLLLVGDVLVG
jgi:hypothetical protein